MSIDAQTILIVEDDLSICSILKDILTDEGFKIATSYNGQEALDYLAANPKPNLILLDVMMPIMDGITFTKNKMNDPKISDIPTIIMSADINILAKLEQLNIKKFLKKPLDIDDLLRNITKLIAPN